MVPDHPSSGIILSVLVRTLRQYYYRTGLLLAIIIILGIQFSSRWMDRWSYLTDESKYTKDTDTYYRSSSSSSSSSSFRKGDDEPKTTKDAKIPFPIRTQPREGTDTPPVLPYVPRAAMVNSFDTPYRICCIGVSPENTCWIQGNRTGIGYPIVFYVSTLRDNDKEETNAIYNYARYYEDYACGRSYILANLCSSSSSTSTERLTERFRDRFLYLPDDQTMVQIDNTTVYNKTYSCYDPSTGNYALSPIHPSRIIELSLFLSLYRITTIFTIQNNVRLPNNLWNSINMYRNYTIMVQGIDGTDNDYHLQEYINRSTIVPVYSYTTNRKYHRSNSVHHRPSDSLPLADQHKYNKRQIYNTYLRQKAQAIELNLQAKALGRSLKGRTGEESTTVVIPAATIGTGSSSTTSSTTSSSTSTDIPRTAVVPPTNFPTLKFVTHNPNIPRKPYVTVVPWMVSWETHTESIQTGLAFTFTDNGKSFATFRKETMEKQRSVLSHRTDIYRYLGIPKEATVFMVYGYNQEQHDGKIFCRILQDYPDQYYFIFLHPVDTLDCSSTINNEATKKITYGAVTGTLNSTDPWSNVFRCGIIPYPGTYILPFSFQPNENDKFSLLSLSHGCIQLSDQSFSVTNIECLMMDKLVVTYAPTATTDREAQDRKDGYRTIKDSTALVSLVTKWRQELLDTSRKDDGDTVMNNPQSIHLSNQERYYNQYNPHTVIKDFIFQLGILPKLIQYNQGIT